MPYRPIPSAVSRGELLVFVCQGPSCGERGGAELLAALRAGAVDGLPVASLRACASTCMDSCATGPNVHVVDDTAQLTGTTLDSLQAHLRAREAVHVLGRPGAGERPAASPLEDRQSSI